jgi:very-short-patch-repair endonuclease
VGGAKLKPSGKFELLWMVLRGPKLTPEFKFDDKRKFRFDFYCESNGLKVAIELEGGVFIRGRHLRPGGFLRDMEKYNLAASKGILVFRIPSHDISQKWLSPIVETITKGTTK